MKERLEFYRRCYEDCKRIIKDIDNNPDIDRKRKEKVIDQMLDRMNDLQKMIDLLED